MAVLDVQNLIPESRDVETGSAALRELYAALELLLGEPFVVREAELELVAVFVLFGASEDGQIFLRLYVANFFQILTHLFVLVLQLLIVAQVLPLAPATNAEIVAFVLYAVVAVFVHVNDFSFEVGAALFGDLNIHDIARHTASDEYHALVVSTYGLALVADIC